jgi:DNA polymerase-1
MDSHHLYIVDGSSYIFRAFYGVPPLTTRAGFPTNALFGFTKMLTKLLSEAESQSIAVVFDTGAPTFRDELYPEYKANRAECPQDLIPQMPFFRDIARTLGLCVLELDGVEADDVIGTLVKKSAPWGPVTIVSADKDLCQLVTESVNMWDTMKGVVFGPKEVEEKFGVPPRLVGDYLGLIGDSSDNIPGVDGIGPKTAVQLLTKFGSLEKVINSPDEIEGDASIRGRAKVAQNIREKKEQAILSRKLVEIKMDVPVLLDGKNVFEISEEEFLAKLVRKTPDQNALIELGKKLEFESLFRGIAGKQEAQDPSKVATLETASASDDSSISSFIRGIPKDAEIVIAIKGTTDNALNGELAKVALSYSGKVINLEITSGAQAQKILAPLFNMPRSFVCYNIKEGIKLLIKSGVEIAPKTSWFDIQVSSHILESERSEFSLESLAFSFGSGDIPDPSTCSPVDYEVIAVRSIWERQSKELAENDLKGIFTTVDAPLVEILARLEFRGIKLDTVLLGQLSSDAAVELEILSKDLKEMAGGEFNLNSPKQLGEVLFQKLGLPTKGLKKTKTGISTDAGVLEKLSKIHPFPEKVLRYRSIFKLKSTYLDSLPTHVSAYSGRLHTKLHQTVTGTGRLSSSDPNLQNIPIQTSEGKRIREAFIAEEGTQLISADYSQIELRVLAQMSGDKALIAAFKEDQDIHSKTAREILNIPTDRDVTSSERRIGKTINFGVVYGMGAFRLSKDLEIPFEVAQSYIDGYFERFSGVKEFFAKLEHDAETKGFVTTLFGRRRNISSLERDGGRDGGYLMRAAINAPIQGTAADIIKLAMIEVERALKPFKSKMLLQIHDELLFESPIEENHEVQRLIVQLMEGVVGSSWLVPLRVECGVGKTWAASHG